MKLPENQPAIWRAFLRLLFLQQRYKKTEIFKLFF